MPKRERNDRQRPRLTIGNLKTQISDIFSRIKNLEKLLIQIYPILCKRGVGSDISTLYIHIFVQKNQEDRISAKMKKKIFKISRSNATTKRTEKTEKHVFFCTFFLYKYQKNRQTQGNNSMTYQKT